MNYAHECCRCGFCCLHEICPIGMALFGTAKPCEGLSFDGDIATCSAAGIVPVGDGCCIQARAFKDGVEYDFASLPPELKWQAASDILRRL